MPHSSRLLDPYSYILVQEYSNLDSSSYLTRIFGVDVESMSTLDYVTLHVEGLGSIYGDHELKESMDRSAELKIVDHSLWKHFERFAYVTY